MIRILNLPGLKARTCFVVKGAFSEELCRSLRQGIPFQRAITHYPTSYRNNDRYVVDDPELASKLLQSIRNYIPQTIHENGTEWRLSKLNSRIRFCRCLPNQYFNKHLDGVFHESGTLRSKLIFMVYLNGKADFTGGSTLFFPSKTSDEVIDSFLPDAGDLIIFDHAIWHSGSMVVSGPKHHIGTVLSLTKLDDNTFFSSGADGKIFLWNTQTGTQIGEWLLHSDWCRKIGVISQNPTILFTLSEDFTFKLWKFENLDMILLSQYTDCYPLTVFAFESESKTLWVGNK